MNQSPGSRPVLPAGRVSWIDGLLISICLGYASCFVSANLHGRFEHRNESINEQLGIVELRNWTYDGQDTYYIEFQNRLLFASLLKVALSLHVGNPTQVYLLLRMATCVVAFLVLWWVLRTVANSSAKTSAAGLGLLAYVLIFTGNYPWEHATDYPDVAFMALFLWAAVGRHHFAAVVLAIAASFNRESSPALGILWFCLYAYQDRRPKTGDIAFAAGLFLASMATVYGLRFGLGHAVGSQTTTDEVIGIQRLGINLREFLAHPQPFGWPIFTVLVFLPQVMWILWNRRDLDPLSYRLVLATTVIVLCTYVRSNHCEMRILIPPTVWLVFLAARLETLSCVSATQHLSR